MYEILDILGAPKEETLYFGDSDVDVLTARNAGVEMAAVTWGYRPEGTLIRAGAARLLHSPAEIPGLFGI